jgi:peptidoglycan/xylan/chitin deacetylase (PgdA/CDA1 family)
MEPPVSHIEGRPRVTRSGASPSMGGVRTHLGIWKEPARNAALDPKAQSTIRYGLRRLAATGPVPDRPSRRGFAAFLSVVIALILLTAWWRFPTEARREGVPHHRETEGVPHHGETAGYFPHTLVSLAEAETAVRRFVRLGLPIRCGGGKGRYVALTFDDGPGPYTEGTIDLLRSSGARATFFFNGIKLEDWFIHLPREASRIGAVGNHTWNHVALPSLSQEEMVSEIDKTKVALEEATGAPVTLFRPPYGQHNDIVDAHVRERGMLLVLWSIDSGDSLPGATGPAVRDHLKEHLAPGAVILLHENRGSTHNALPRILKLLQHRDFTPVSIPELLALDPPSVHQLRAGEC